MNAAAWRGEPPVNGENPAELAPYPRDAKSRLSLRNVPRYIAGWYYMISPPLVIDDLVIVGSAINDNTRVDMPSGVVRAFDVRSGALRWSWDPIRANPPETPDSGPTTWRTGAANAWAAFVADPVRDLVFVPTGSASPDAYGGLRPGDDRWANSVVALPLEPACSRGGSNSSTMIYGDYDSASPPLLATLHRDGMEVPVVIQGNKTGFLYVLHRGTGEPFFPIEERPVPQSDVPGEVTSPTQPFPLAPPALASQSVSVGDASGIDTSDRDACRAALHGLRNDGIFTPPSFRGSVAFPGIIGGMNWSGYAFDPEHRLLVVNTNNLPTVVSLLPRDEFREAVSQSGGGEYAPQEGAPYGMRRRSLLAPSSSLPCSPPPWGLLTAVDMNDGKIRWQVPLGTFAPDNRKVPIGALNLGGPIVTAGGVIFVGGTWDPHIRAFDVESGQELWSAALPASGHATPMTYRLLNGKQYVVIAAGGSSHFDQEPQSDSLVAFALP